MGVYPPIEFYLAHALKPVLQAEMRAAARVRCEYCGRWAQPRATQCDSCGAPVPPPATAKQPAVQ